MKFMCLGHMAESKWQAMSKNERDAMVEECLAYDDVLKQGGHWTGNGEALQSTRSAKTMRLRGGKLVVTDGPYAETKEQLGGFGVLEADDMGHAVELMSKHPGVHFGPFEIRPIDEATTERCQAVLPPPDAAAEGVKVVCLGYGDESYWISAPDPEAAINECLAYGEVLSRYGKPEGGLALQSAATAKTLRMQGGKVLVTDGPYAETKEQLGGAAILRFKDMDQAVRAWSQHPCLRMGDSLELRPADEAFTAQVAARLEGTAAK